MSYCSTRWRPIYWLINSDVSIEDLVNVFHFQKDYFNRLIRRHTGLTYSSFLQKIRLHKAEELLLNTKMPVKKIIQTVGY